MTRNRVQLKAVLGSIGIKDVTNAEEMTAVQALYILLNKNDEGEAPVKRTRKPRTPKTGELSETPIAKSKATPVENEEFTL